MELKNVQWYKIQSLSFSFIIYFFHSTELLRLSRKRKEKEKRKKWKKKTFPKNDFKVGMGYKDMYSVSVWWNLVRMVNNRNSIVFVYLAQIFTPILEKLVVHTSDKQKFQVCAERCAVWSCAGEITIPEYFTRK